VLSFRNETKTHVDRKQLGVIDSAPVLEHAQRIKELAREAAEKNAIQTQIDGPLPYREKPSFKAANYPSSPRCVSEHAARSRRPRLGQFGLGQRAPKLSKLVPFQVVYNSPLCVPILYHAFTNNSSQTQRC
jgi:hypothetical protein